MNDPILQILVQNGYLDEVSAQEIADTAKTEGKSIRQAVLDQGILSEDDLLGVIAAYQDTEAIDLGAMTIDTDVTEAIPASTARMYNVFPVAADESSVTLATFDIIDPRISDELLFTLSKEVRFVMAREKDVMDRISQYYGDSNESVADMIKSLGEGMSDDEGLATANVNDIASMENAANSSAIIRFVNLILYQGVVDHASDIHIEPFEKDFKIRYRVDGALYEMKAPDVKMAPAIISRVKILSNLNIAERRIPQDGRIALTVAGRPVDLRVSCLPTAHGESVVMRILDQTTTSLDLENVGFAEDIYEQITMDIEKPNGIFIVTGPTGSGKTTTLYSVLRRINTIDTKLLTAEEPVEYNVARRRSVELESLLRRLAARLAMPAEPEAVAGLMDAAAPDLPAGHRQHPARVGLRVLLACSGLMLAAVACYLYTYHEATDRLRDMLGSTREQILEDAALHAHNSDSLVVSRYSLDGQHTPASAGEGETSAEIREMEDGPQETPEPAEPESAESGPEGE